MTKTGFPSLPNELVLQIAFDANDSSLLSLLMCNTTFRTLLTPVLHTRALASRGPQSAMQWAAAQGHVTLVKFLLARGIHPDDDATRDELPALHAAVSQGRVDIAELLASHGADVNRHNCTAYFRYESVIHIAAANGDSAMIKLLAAHGADVCSENMMGMYLGTPIHMAVLRSHVAAVRTLLDLNVPLDGEDTGWDTPLEVAAMVAAEDADTEEWWESMVEIGKMLVNAGAPVRFKEEGLNDRRTIKFQRIMIEAKQKLTGIE